MSEVGFPRYDRRFFDSSDDFTLIGGGEIGGKAQGLAFVKQFLGAHPGVARYEGVSVTIPTLTVLATDVFDAFLEENRLRAIALSGEPDRRIAHAFQSADLPAAHVGDLRALVESARQPLAVRSSSLLEDALFEPCAGVYGTKMIPNNEPDPAVRFRKLLEAIKFVYSSTFFSGAKAYARSVGRDAADEKMAVIVQEVVGERRGGRFYPAVSGVARSFNYYPMGHARPDDGVVNLALGLGKTIVDGGSSWSYSPAYPRANPPFGSVGAQLDQSQTTFWAVNMGRPPAYDPIAETEYLVEADLQQAEDDGVLRFIASTYDPESDRVSPGLSASGPRMVTFASLLSGGVLPLNDLVKDLLALSREAAGAEVEMEFAMTLDRERALPARFGFLQLRPLVVSREAVSIADEELRDPRTLIASGAVLGNGIIEGVRDVVFVRRDRFDSAATRAIAREVEKMNRTLLDAGRPYLLVGFGRWGSSDPWLGIPVAWSEICGARVIVEASFPGFSADPSQGSHFFHNITSRQVPYFTVREPAGDLLRWEALERMVPAAEGEYVRLARSDDPLRVLVDGRTGRGIVQMGRRRSPTDAVP